MAKETQAGKEADKGDQPIDPSITTEQHRVEEAGGIPIGIFTDEERAARREQHEKEGRIAPPPEQRNPTTESEKLLDQQAQQVFNDRQQLKERQAADAQAQAEASQESAKQAKQVQKDQAKAAKSHK